LKTEPPLSSSLGGWASECDSDDFIRFFVCTGSKTYAKTTMNGEADVKCKGIGQNYQTMQIMTPELFLAMLMDDPEGVDEVYDAIKDVELKRYLKKIHAKEKERHPGITMATVPDPQMEKDRF
jgi:hypothetical protein